MKVQTRQERWDEEERLKTQLANLDLEKLRSVQRAIHEWMDKFYSASERCNGFK